MSRTYRTGKYKFIDLPLSTFSILHSDYIREELYKKDNLEKHIYKSKENDISLGLKKEISKSKNYSFINKCRTSKRTSKKLFKRFWNKEERQFYRNEIYKNMYNSDYELQLFKHSKLTDFWDYD